ncbi:hypothetical protein QBC32DRAFT_21325 [Pseudoneurospora amorphoporcata]|uniref:2EXR domain-containing protein n=1 Tax=Pseudoneurospora amorphoporcata TaxID=241081 RepID=A0AAN6NQE5_9PEZI|nr:hypothetical protein QBC32DRAFT_21325 [Pseudoneurospora amorphoporcata]
MPPTSREHRIHKDEPDYSSIIDGCIDTIRCCPEEEQVTHSTVRQEDLMILSRLFDPTNSTGKGKEKLYELFPRFPELPSELREKIWMMSVDPTTATSKLSAYQGTVSNAVTLCRYGGPIVREHRSLWLGTRDDYKRIRLFEINRESRDLAFIHWGSPRPSTREDLAPYLFNPHKDTLGVRLDKSPRPRQETDSSNAMYETSLWEPMSDGYRDFTVPAPTNLLSRIYRIELQLDRVEDMRPHGHDWTSPGAKNPLTFLFQFPNLRHLTFVFRRPQLAEIPQRDGKTVIHGKHIMPVTEAVQSYNYYHLDTIQCLHSFLRLFRDPITRDRAKTAFRNLRTIGITANLKPIRDELYWYPERPEPRVAMVPKSISPLAWVDDNTYQSGNGLAVNGSTTSEYTPSPLYEGLLDTTSHLPDEDNWSTSGNSGN